MGVKMLHFSQIWRPLYVAGVVLAACSASAADTQLGKGGSVVQGSAGPSGSSASPQLQMCDKPLGTIAVQEPQSYSQQALARFGLPSPTGLIRLMIQQSNCFTVVERGMAMQNLMQERQLGASGELQNNSNVGKGQMLTADYVVTPEVAISENNAGGLGAAAGFLPGFAGKAAAGIAGSMKFKTAQTTMLLADARTSAQITAATGSAKTTDFSLGAVLGGAGVGAGLGAYENTSEGKVIAASYLDNWNKIVAEVRNNPQLASARASAPQAAAGIQMGDVLVSKIKGVKIFAEPDVKGGVVAADAGESVYLGEEVQGFYKVASPSGEGWVQKVLVVKK